MFSIPTAEATHSGKQNITGGQTDMPIHRTWDCCKCDAAFFKDTDRNIAALVGLVPWRWPPEEIT